MMLGTIRPIALSPLSQAFRSLVISRRCHSALYECWLHNFLPEVSPGSLARVQVLGRHSGCRAWGALRARGSPLSHSILSEFGSALMVQGLVQVNALGQFPVKGLTEPVEVFELVGASAIRRRLQA